jgi:hypothetical protein
MMTNRVALDTLPRMGDATILRLLDVERQTVADTGVTLEKTPYVVRAIGLESSWNGIVYSRFSPSETETIVNAEIKYFAQLNRDFEWKVYSHDEPRDLLSQLRNRGELQTPQRADRFCNGICALLPHKSAAIARVIRR